MQRDRSADTDTQPKLDALDRRLINELRGDARLAYATLGSRLGVTGMTAANRLQRLRQNDLLHIRVSPDFEAYGLTTQILGLLQADVGAHEASIALLVASPFVLRLERVTGEYDLAFTAVFPSEAVMGGLVRELQSLPGVRRLVVHHRMATAKDEDGWSAVWAEPEQEEAAGFEIAPGVRIPEHLRAKAMAAANWLVSFVAGDFEAVRALSEPNVSFTIMPPQADAGTYDGLDAVLEESKVAARAYRHLWHRILAVGEAKEPYNVVIDAINTAERRRGHVRTAFSRMAFGFANDHVQRVISLGQMELAELPEAEPEPAEMHAGH